MGKLVINQEKCKGCELCLAACPKGLLVMGKEINSYGNYYPILTDEEKCISCTLCAITCPDICIDVYK